MQELTPQQGLRNVLKPQILSYYRKPGRLSASFSLSALSVVYFFLRLSHNMTTPNRGQVLISF